jgi:hypothetical protein
LLSADQFHQETITMSDRDERIKQRAYEIWEEQGRPEGKELDHWQQAAEEFNANSVEDPMGDELSLIPDAGDENLSVLGADHDEAGSATQIDDQLDIQNSPSPEAPQSGVERGGSQTKQSRGKKRS